MDPNLQREPAGVLTKPQCFAKRLPKDLQQPGKGLMATRSRHIYEFGGFRLNVEEKQLVREDSPVPLTPKAFDLLVVLVENSGHLQGKAELIDRIWPDSFVEEANLSVKMSELRRALGEGPNEHQYIETVPRRGYRFVASVTEHFEGDDEIAAVPKPSVDDADKGSPAITEEQIGSAPLPKIPDRSLFLRRWPVLLVGLVVLSSLLFAFDAGGVRQRLLGKAEPARIRSLAVLPLENLSGDESQGYFADGMTEVLITDLAKIGDLRVISRQSVMKYKEVRQAMPEVASALNVDAVLTGSVVRSGDRVRITVHLIHAATDQHLWTHSYERDLSDVLTLQREVARDVVSEIRIKLTPQEQMQFGAASPVNPEAFDHYLRGKFYLHVQKKDENAAAIASLERAVAVDPSFAAAHAELAQGYVWRLFLFSPDEKALPEKAFMATEKALALDPNLAVAYLARGRLLWTPANHFPHEKAIREYRRALELNPNLDEARNQLALVYCHIGAFDEALRELERAVATNPSNALAQFRIGQTLVFQRKYEQALAALRAVPSEANPALVGHQIVWALFNLGRKDEALATLDRYLAEYPDDNGGLFTSQQAVLAASDGRYQIAEEKITLAIERGKGFGHFHHTAYHIACAYALMNKPEQAVKWLEAAAETGFPCYPLFEGDGNLSNLRQDPRFIALMAKLKPQWEHFKTVL
jgi:TolB-like protein/DNA-binding winged helix-turn-helix (wHTH) protein/tetratricopeptide (TPR) repeat protein